jgi:hypothetical protein
MTTITIDRSGLSLADLVITSDGSSGIELVDFAPGQKQVDNTYAESAWRSGGKLTRSRARITAMRLVVRFEADTAAEAIDAAEELVQALEQWDYTITEDTGTTRIEYACMPASTEPGRDPVLLEAGILIVTASIPRQP